MVISRAAAKAVTRGWKSGCGAGGGLRWRQRTPVAATPSPYHPHLWAQDSAGRSRPQADIEGLHQRRRKEISMTIFPALGTPVQQGLLPATPPLPS